jgi:hypothetical protein
MAKTYSDLVQDAGNIRSHPFDFTIPQGYFNPGEDDEAFRHRRLQECFARLVVEVEIAMRNQSPLSQSR